MHVFLLANYKGLPSGTFQVVDDKQGKKMVKQKLAVASENLDPVNPDHYPDNHPQFKQKTKPQTKANTVTK